MRYFTHYWKNDTWENQRHGMLGHTAGNQFRPAGVQPGDRIFIITVVKGKLRLGGALDVERVVGQQEAEEIFGEDVWEASDHVLAKKSTPFTPELVVPEDVVRRIRFSKGQAAKFSSRGGLDQQTMRGVRELSAASAELLNARLAQGMLDLEGKARREAAKEGDEEDLTRRKGSQGWQPDAAKRSLIEDHAQELLEKHFRQLGWEVQDKRRGNPFDCVATKDGERKYLEAKGTETDGASVLVTQGEVNFAREHPGECVIGIVSGIRFDEDGALESTSGNLKVHNWDPDNGVLTARTYTWKPPRR